ncbi:hypothetical protein [Amycolatopsis anabasis]|uniref:hypothetical protein n=1 Tax=Amycolatopsis anabasis TaxID=1840409 RepID=UPI00131B46B8|nr:hypothetical protein [Amycolatopsis anabasis]
MDDKFHSHNKVRKVLADDPAALALWVVAGSWSSDNLTDGLIPDHQLPWLFPAGADEQARKLVTARLWRRVRGGYEFHEWQADSDGTKRNPSKEEVEEERRKKAEAGRKGGLASGKARSTRQAPAEASAEAAAEAPAGGVVELPTRPDREPLQGSPGGRASAQAPEAPARPPSSGRSTTPARASPNAVRCLDHEYDDDPPRCGACERARRQAEQDAYEKRVEARQAELRATTADKRRAIANCSLCDEDGYRGTVLCNHDPDAEDRARRGRQLLNDAMGWPTNHQDPP